MFRPIEGKKFGRLTVIGFDHKHFARTGIYYYYRCVCDCGTECIVNRNSLKRGDTRSCGCLRRETVSHRRKGRHIGEREA